ncbi:MAG: assimilatory sulfite reductase (NADPH) flavoprotein subunit [Verrucomicrobiota bacterium]
MQLPDHAPFSKDEKSRLEAALAGLPADKASWLSAFLAGASQGAAALATTPVAAAAALKVDVFYGSESGNAEGLAYDTQKALKQAGLAASVNDLADTRITDLSKVSHALIITSTWGDGEPPDSAVAFHEALMAEKELNLHDLQFSVCALGDTSYEKFCQTGKDFDGRLETLGAQRMVDRQDCDVDYDEPFQQWLESVTSALTAQAGTNASAAMAPPAAAAATIEYGKKNPFPAELTEKILLNGRGSAKETLHLEFSLAGSGLSYLPGDSLALIPSNAPDVVKDLIEVTGFSASGEIELKDGSRKSLAEALTFNFDITGLSKNIIEKYNAVLGSSELAALLENQAKLSEYLYGRQIVDLVQDYPNQKLSPQEFIQLLRKLPPRLYSIASSLAAHPDEVHLTVAAVRYLAHGKERKGVASTFVADLLEKGETAPVYVNANKHFKLPQDSDTPIIMVGPGTGIAPFRAFVEERVAAGARGKNWLFFGDQRYSYDFLYQTEWQEYFSDGILTRLDLAFSRDQKEKIYVQHRMLEKSKDLWQWLQDGACFYVCGDASRMAHDVNEALIKVAETEGAMPREAAEEYVTGLQKEKRYLRDVY